MGDLVSQNLTSSALPSAKENINSSPSCPWLQILQWLHLCSNSLTVSKHQPSPFLKQRLGIIHYKKISMAGKFKYYSKWQCRDVSIWNLGKMRITTWVYWHLAKPTMSAYVVCPARYLGSNVTKKGIFLPCDKGSLWIAGVLTNTIIEDIQVISLRFGKIWIQSSG